MFYPQDRQFNVGASKVPMKPPMRRIVSFEHQPERKSFKHFATAKENQCQSPLVPVRQDISCPLVLIHLPLFTLDAKAA